MTGFVVTVVFAQVVAARQAVAAFAATLMRFAGDGIARFEVENAFAHLDYFTGPLVPGNERIRRGPDAGESAADDLGIAAADGDATNPTQDLMRRGFRNRDVPNFECTRRRQNKRLHLGLD